MHIETFSHRLGQGWSAALPAARDSARTLVVAFGAPGYADAPQALDELASAFPNSAIVGCSSAGEIHDHLVADGTLVVAIAQFERTELAVASTQIESAADSAAAGARIGGKLAVPGPSWSWSFRRACGERDRSRPRTLRLIAAGYRDRRRSCRRRRPLCTNLGSGRR
jgi:hypothetical protein